MSKIHFHKMQGAGNDFILIDNRADQVLSEKKVAFVRAVCPRARAVGADGVIFIENDDEYDFAWDFYNADGSSAEMCGNGARCAAVYASSIGATGTGMTFRTIAGPIRAELTDLGARVLLTDTAPAETFGPLDIIGESIQGYRLNTGVPHAVIPVDNIDAIDIQAFGADVRYHDRFAPAGTNVNVMQRIDDGIAIRTYERGVEGETLACGTGAAAAAICSAPCFGLASPVSVRTASGDLLRISFNSGPDGTSDIWLDGPARLIYTATLVAPLA